jgi:uncharacterized membrane protein
MAKTAVKVAGTVAAGAALGALVARKRWQGSQSGRVVRAVTIDRPPAQVYEFLRDPARLLGALDGRASKWIGKMHPQLVEEEPGHLLSWRAADGPMPHEGRVILTEAPNDRGTELTVDVSHGGEGSAKQADVTLRTNLRRIKQMLEAGTIVEVQGQPTGRGPIQERLTRKVQDKLTAGGRP